MLSSGYQETLYIIARPWLALIHGPIKPGVTLIAYCIWMALMFTVPMKKEVAAIMTGSPLMVLLASLVASLFLLLDIELHRNDSN